MTPEGDPKGWVRKGSSLAVLAISVCMALLIGAAAIRNGMTAWSLRKEDLAAALRWSPKSTAALSATAAANFTARDDDKALQAARSALARSPFDVTALRVIGMVEGRGDQARRRDVLRQAFRLTRRDSAVSSWLLSDALTNGDVKTAALLADILLRRRVEVGDSVFRVLHGVIHTPAGQAAVAERLTLRPPWREPFLGGAGLAADPTAVAGLLAELRNRGGAPTDIEAHHLFKRLARDQRYDELRLARARIFGDPAGRDQLVYDADLNGLPGSIPLNWELPSTSGGPYGWKTEASETGRIRLDRAPSSSGPLLRQLIFLKAGRYSVSVTAQNAEMEADEAFILEVQCDTRVVIARAPVQTSNGEFKITRRDFVVPPNACAAQWLQIVASPDSLTETAVVLDRIDVRPSSSERAPAGE